uniref:Uncharacterized protein n=1 Tax=Romanomermis culicivorax TaxID=13658 RepID=A0A915II39_ROMCU
MSSALWMFFDLKYNDRLTAICKICKICISRGSAAAVIANDDRNRLLPEINAFALSRPLFNSSTLISSNSKN